MLGKRMEFGGTGIFHALNLLESCDMEKADEEDYEWAERKFEEYLPVPDIFAPAYATKGISFFTEYGYKFFKEAIDILSNLFIDYCEEAGLGELSEISMEIPDEMIVFKDEHQFVILEKDFALLKARQ